jgi:hypothetical protein
VGKCHTRHSQSARNHYPFLIMDRQTKFAGPNFISLRVARFSGGLRVELVRSPSPGLSVRARFRQRSCIVALQQPTRRRSPARLSSKSAPGHLFVHGGDRRIWRRSIPNRR